MKRIMIAGSASALAMALVALVGCGAGVVVDPSEGAGGGAGGDDPCPRFCDSPATACIGSPTKEACLERCEADLLDVGICRDAMAAFYACETENRTDPEDCTGAPCKEAIDAVYACVFPAGSCEPGECGNDPGDPLMCKHSCGGVSYEVECTASSELSCTCRIDGQVVGACTQAPTILPVVTGCCAGFFAASQ